MKFNANQFLPLPLSVRRFFGSINALPISALFACVSTSGHSKGCCRWLLSHSMSFSPTHIFWSTLVSRQRSAIILLPWLIETAVIFSFNKSIELTFHTHYTFYICLNYFYSNKIARSHEWAFVYPSGRDWTFCLTPDLCKNYRTTCSICHKTGLSRYYRGAISQSLQETQTISTCLRVNRQNYYK